MRGIKFKNEKFPFKIENYKKIVFAGCRKWTKNEYKKEKNYSPIENIKHYELFIRNEQNKVSVL